MTSGSPWRRKTRSRASRKRPGQRGLGRSCARGGAPSADCLRQSDAPLWEYGLWKGRVLRSAPVNRRLRLYHFVDIVAGIPDLAQDRDAIAAQEWGRAVVIAATGRKPVGKLHVDDLAFHRVVNLAEKSRVGEMLVRDQTFERVHAAGRDVG